MRVLVTVIAFILIASCKPETYIPKPRGFARIDTPQDEYQSFNRDGYPYTFEYPVYGQIASDSMMKDLKANDPYAMNIEFPDLGGTIYLSYKKIDAAHPLDKLLDDAHEMSYFHTKKADYINAPAFHTENHVHGVVYSVGGNAASSYQFFATDSSAHFLRGALYFNTTPNADSLKPVTDFLHTDIEHLLGTLRWR